MIPVLVVLTLVVIFQSMGSPGQQDTASAPPTDAATAQPELSVSASVSASADPSSSDAAGGSPAAMSSPAGEPEAAAPAPPASVAATTNPEAPAVLPDLTIKDANGHPAAAVAAGALPAGAPFVKSGAGVWHVVPGTTPVRGNGPQRFTYTVEVENGSGDANSDKEFAAAVDAALADPRSWIGGKQFSLQRIDKGEPNFRVSLTSQMTVRAGCGFDIPLEASCYNGAAGRVFINDARWVRGAMSFNGNLDAYRAYAINHEVGHALGMRHQPCPATGAPAPVMMQQSWSVSNNDLNMLDPGTIPKDGKVCKANAYPFPTAAAPQSVSGSPSAAAG
jgi:hypothetical protein